MFCPILASLIVISFILSTLGKHICIYAKYSVAVNGNFNTENRFKILKSQRNRRQIVEKFRQKRNVNQKNFTRNFFNLILFSIKKRTYRINAI